MAAPWADLRESRDVYDTLGDSSKRGLWQEVSGVSQEMTTNGRGSTPTVPFGLGEFTAHFRTYFSGDWDVHWGDGPLSG